MRLTKNLYLMNLPHFEKKKWALEITYYRINLFTRRNKTARMYRAGTPFQICIGRRGGLPPPQKKIYFLSDLYHYFFYSVKFRKKNKFENKYLYKIARAIRYTSEDKVIVIFNIWTYNIKFCFGHDMEFIFKKWVSDIKAK